MLYSYSYSNSIYFVVKYFFSFIGNTPIYRREIYVIPLNVSAPESEIPSVSHLAWEELPETNDRRIQNSSIKILSSVNYHSTGQKCCFFSRGHKIGVDVPKCCEFGIAEEHLIEHFYDDLLSSTSSCICSLNTLAEILPKLTNQNQTTGLNSSSDSKEYVIAFNMYIRK